MIEVERKFHFTDNLRPLLLKLNAVELGQFEFTDSYYDTQNFTFTSSDCWLRLRDGKWQLKHKPLDSVPGKSHDWSSQSTRYCETESIPEILAILYAALTTSLEKLHLNNLCSKTMDDMIYTQRSPTDYISVDEFLESNECVEFATITTMRKSYKLEGVRIDLDSTDFGFTVGELEVMCTETEVDQATKKIELIAQKLGISLPSNAVDMVVPGKLDVYLENHYPAHYAKLKSVWSGKTINCR